MNPDWHRTFFRGMTLELWRRATPPLRTKEEAEFLADAFAEHPGGRLLDLPCGNGRLALALAARGFRLTALDQSATLLKEGRAQAKAEGLSIDWRRGDMRSLPWRDRKSVV